MTGTELPVIAAVDGSTHSDDALDWAAREASGRGLPLVVVHVRLLTRRTGQEAQQREAEELLARSVQRVERIAPGLGPTTLSPLDFPSAALVSLSRDASLVVVGSRGLGGFRSLMLGSNSLATAAMAMCPVVVIHGGRPDEEPDGSSPEVFRDIVAGVAADESSEAVLEFAFETAAARPGARLRIVHGWTMFSSMLSGGPVFDREAAADSAERSLAELTAGRREVSAGRGREGARPRLGVPHAGHRVGDRGPDGDRPAARAASRSGSGSPRSRRPRSRTRWGRWPWCPADLLRGGVTEPFGGCSRPDPAVRGPSPVHGTWPLAPGGPH